MENEYLMPFIQAVENDPILQQKQKHLLCLLITSMPAAPEGLVIKELLGHANLSLPSLYRVLHALEKKELVIFKKNGKMHYVSVNLDKLEEMSRQQQAKKHLMSQTTKLRLASSKK